MRSRFLTAAILAFALLVSGNANASRLVIISGLGGEAYYSDLFHRWAMTLVDVASTRLGLHDDQIYVLAEDPDRDSQRISAKSTKENFQELLNTVAQEAGADESVMIVMLGHGTASNSRVLFNIPGRDFDAAELNTMLEPFGNRPIAIVNTAPSSAPFVEQLSAPDRIIITATASAAENQHTHFGGYFVSAFAESGADADKDKNVSLLEAFIFAKKETERFYSDENRVVTEHALLDDNADGIGSLIIENKNNNDQVEIADGEKARNFSLTNAMREDSTDPEMLARLQIDIEARKLVDQIESLKRIKKTQHEEEYRTALENLLVELALNRRKLRSGKYREAVRAAGTILSTTPDDVEHLHTFARAVIQTGDFDAARDAYIRAINTGGENTYIAASELARAELKFGDRGFAFKQLHEVYTRWQQRPADAPALDSSELVAVGRAVQELARTDAELNNVSLNILEEAIRANPKDPNAHVAIGELLLLRDNNTEALEAFRDALKGSLYRIDRGCQGMSRQQAQLHRSSRAACARANRS